MNDDIKKAVQKSRAAAQAPFPKERARFKSLLLTNPNYFGNLVESPFQPVLPVSGNTHYEELACLGYHPQQERLEAVVYVYQPTGYGTDICGAGTSEHVRFYLSYDNGATWQDQGMTSFQAHNISDGTEGGKRLEYAVSLAVNPIGKFCLADPLIKARAILSWNNPPPQGQPNWTPIWGNVREVTILVEPFRILFPHDLFELAQLKFPPLLSEVLDPGAPIKTKTKSLGALELSALYKGKGVPTHRFAYKEIASFVSGKTNLSAEALSAALPGIVIDPGIIDAVSPKTDGDTSYEELKCIGLDPNHPDTLVGIIQVKKLSGYSGGPCTDGSVQYVTFWADFNNNGIFETCLGTASVRVYDLNQIPPEGVQYAVRLPVDLNPYRRPCNQGPRVVPIRAILSWNVPVPCANPNQVPTWGNREETLINIAPMTSAPAGKIAILGGIPVSHIDNNPGGPIQGLTTPSALFATSNIPPDSQGRPCPFGLRVSTQGFSVNGFSYIVEVSQDTFNWTPLLTDLVVTDANGNTATHKANPVTKRFAYLPFNQNVNSLLAHWDTTGDGLWHVRLSVYDAGGVLQSDDTHLIQLDNTWPEASIDITTGLGNCGKFPTGTGLAGTFVARDTYLGGYGLSVAPAVNPPGVGVPSPTSGLTNTSPAPGNAWSLNTTGMRPCGYVVQVTATDRAILNSQSVGHQSTGSAGFCLDQPA